MYLWEVLESFESSLRSRENSHKKTRRKRLVHEDMSEDTFVDGTGRVDRRQQSVEMRLKGGRGLEGPETYFDRPSCPRPTIRLRR